MKWQTGSLTASVDDLTGDADDNVFDADLTVAGAPTLNPFDSIDGGEGTDTLNAVLKGTSAGAPTLEDVEIINAKAVQGTGKIGLANASGVEQVWNDGSTTGNVKFNSVQDLATLGARDIESGTTTLAYAGNSVVAATDTQNIVLDNAETKVNVTAPSNTAIGVENVSIASQGDENSVKFFGSDLVDKSAAIENLEITGEGNLNIDGSNGITAGTIDASAATGDVSLTISDQASANLASGVTERTVNMGAGDDTVDAAAGISANKIDGGEGRDTIVVNGAAANATLVNDLVANVSNFEVLNLNGLAQTVSAGTLSNVGFDELVVTDGAFGGTINALTANSNVTLVDTESTADEITLEVAGAATNDNAELTVATVGQTGGGSEFKLTVDDVENLTVSTSATDEDDFQATTLTATSADALENLTVTGDQAVIFDGAGVGTLESVDVAGVTASNAGADDFTATITVDDATVVGTAESDAISFGAGATITSGEGEDVLFADNTNNSNTTFATVTDLSTDDTLVLNDTATVDEVGSGDTVVQSAAELGTDGAALEEITVQTQPGETADFGDYLQAAFGPGTTDDTGSADVNTGALADGEVGSFEFDGNTYVVANNTGNDFSAGYDSSVEGESAVTGSLVELTGTDLDMSDFAYATIA